MTNENQNRRRAPLPTEEAYKNALAEIIAGRKTLNTARNSAVNALSVNQQADESLLANGWTVIRHPGKRATDPADMRILITLKLEGHRLILAPLLFSDRDDFDAIIKRIETAPELSKREAEETAKI